MFRQLQVFAERYMKNPIFEFSRGNNMRIFYILFLSCFLNFYAFSQDVFEMLYEENENAIEAFLQNYDINDYKDSESRSVLMCLLESYDNELIDLAILKTENINETDNDGWTALMYACFATDNISIYNKLLEKGASISQYTNDMFNMNSLMVAIWQNREYEIINLLAKDKDSINWKNKDGITPIILAEKFYKDQNVFEILKKNGAY